MATGYTKTLVLKTSDGDVTFTGGRAYAIQRQLDDNGELIHFTNPENDTQIDYYKVNGVSCQFCLVATVTAGTKEVEDPTCEDALGCSGDGTTEDVDAGDSEGDSDGEGGGEGA